jgi:hypothetical protein
VPCYPQPAYGSDIDRNTHVKAFREELKAGKAKLKHRLGTKLVERIEKGDAWAIQFGFSTCLRLARAAGWKNSSSTQPLTEVLQC